MALNELPLAKGGIYRDFEADVLSELKRHQAMMHRCPVTRVECKLDGGIAVWFKGPRPGVEMWEGALRFNFPLLKDKHLLADVNAIVETVLQMLYHIAQREDRPLIERAKV